MLDQYLTKVYVYLHFNQNNAHNTAFGLKFNVVFNKNEIIK
jgi:hypothetical protein